MIIGIVGRKRHGKDTVGAYLEDDHGFHVTAFALPLKRACRDIFGLSAEQVYGDQKEEVDPRWKLTPRFILQKFGTEVGRAIHPQTWIKATLDRAEGDVAITDVRFVNEAAAIRDRGGYLIKVIRPSKMTRAQLLHAQVAQWSSLAARALAWWQGEHPSEAEVDLIEADYTIINDGTLSDLQREVACVQGLLRAGLT